MAAAPIFGRVVTAMVTPFTTSNTVDVRATAVLVEHLISTGTQGIVVAGTTGESPTLSVEEKLGLFQLVKDVANGRAKVIAGTGSNNTIETIALTKEAEKIGVDGALLVTPYYNRPSQEGLYAHYSAVAVETGLPIMLYNVPARTGANLQASTCVRIAARHSNVVAVKEASKDLEQIGEVLATAPAGFQVYSGDDGTTLPVLSLGGSGVVSVTSHVYGQQLAEMHEAWFSGDIARATELHLKSLALTKTLFLAPNPVTVKAAIKLLGIVPNDLVRLPLVSATEDEREKVATGLKHYGLL